MIPTYDVTINLFGSATPLSNDAPVSSGDPYPISISLRSLRHCEIRAVQFGWFIDGPLHIFFGGGDQDRTDYLLTASQALYQVSYAPMCILVPLAGIALTTSTLPWCCSTH